MVHPDYGLSWLILFWTYPACPSRLILYWTLRTLAYSSRLILFWKYPAYPSRVILFWNYPVCSEWPLRSDSRLKVLCMSIHTYSMLNEPCLVHPSRFYVKSTIPVLSEWSIQTYSCSMLSKCLCHSNQDMDSNPKHITAHNRASGTLTQKKIASYSFISYNKHIPCENTLNKFTQQHQTHLYPSLVLWRVQCQRKSNKFEINAWREW